MVRRYIQRRQAGCGKSILASSIIGLIPKNAKITSGEIIFDKENISDIAERLFEV